VSNGGHFDVRKWAERYGPFGLLLLYLIFQFPPYPSVIGQLTFWEFTGVKAVGLFAGCGFAFRITMGTVLVFLFGAKVRSPKFLRRFGDGITPVADGLCLWFIVVGYYDLLPDAETHIRTLLFVFFVMNVLIGALIAWIIPALRSLVR
jgi:hypothetical protein